MAKKSRKALPRFRPALRTQGLVSLCGGVAAVPHVLAFGGGYIVLRGTSPVIDVAETLETAVPFDLCQRVGQRLAVARLCEGVAGVERKDHHCHHQEQSAQRNFRGKSHVSQDTRSPTRLPN